MNPEPRVLNKKHDFIPADAVYVGRPSIWGNPYIIGKHGTRAEVIELYKEYLRTVKPYLVSMAKEHLKGKDLVCWCSPEDCHADVLLEIANEQTT